MISAAFHVVFTQPMYNALVFLTGVLPFHDLGLAIIILTILVRLILLPFTHHSVVAQRKMKEIEPELTKIKEKYKKNKEEQARQTMELYKAHGISPFSGFFALLIQFPVLIALFIVLRTGGLVLKPEDLYSFIHFPEAFRTAFLGILDLSKTSIVLAALSGISQFIQIQLSMPSMPKRDKKATPSFGAELQRSMALQTKYIMPIFIFVIATRFSSGLALYWTTSNVFAILHEIIVAKRAKKAYDGTDTNSKKINRGPSGEAGNTSQS